MRYVTLCSGIEATTVAWSDLGWIPVAFSEIDPFACSVLASRFPTVENLGDIREIDWRDFHERNGNIDILFASTPCQSFSVAGNRLGLDGESRIMLEFIRAARELVELSGGKSPRYVVWENVPGCLTSSKGEDFRCLLRELDECGFGVSWRVLDSEFAQVLHRGDSRLERPVPQRRERIYVVGSLGSDGSGEILFERSCLQGDYPKGRDARKALASDAREGAEVGGTGVMSMSSVRHRAAIDDGISGTLDAGHEQPIVVIDRAAFNQGKNALYAPHVEEASVMDTLVARGPHAVCYPSDGSRYVVRRITPLESERLQALPDGWTDLTGCDADSVTAIVSDSLGYERGSDGEAAIRKSVTRWSKRCPDGPRYKATGNSITTTVLKIIGYRIEAFDTLHYDEIGL